MGAGAGSVWTKDQSSAGAESRIVSRKNPSWLLLLCTVTTNSGGIGFPDVSTRAFEIPLQLAETPGLMSEKMMLESRVFGLTQDAKPAGTNWVQFPLISGTPLALSGRPTS